MEHQRLRQNDDALKPMDAAITRFEQEAEREAALVAEEGFLREDAARREQQERPGRKRPHSEEILPRLR